MVTSTNSRSWCEP